MAFPNRRAGARHTDNLSSNHKLLYQYIRTRGPLARADLVRISDLTFPSISRMVAELLELGLVQETTQRRGGMGKPPTELVLVPEAACALGVAISDGRAHAVVIDALGTVLEQPDTEVGDDLGASLTSVLAGLETPAAKLVGVGVTQADSVLDETVKETLEQQVGYPVVSASLAGAGALRERYFGAAQTLDAFLYLNVGENLASAALLGRRLLASTGQLAGLAEVLGQTLDESWDTNLPTLSTTLLTAQELLAPEALIVGGDVSNEQVSALKSTLESQRRGGAAALPVVKGFSGPTENALAAATLPLYNTFNVASPASASS